MSRISEKIKERGGKNLKPKTNKFMETVNAVTKNIDMLRINKMKEESIMTKPSLIKQEKPMTNIEKHINLLGYQCTDKITGLKGVITSISFDLYGCVQAIVHPGLDEKGETLDTLWFDIARLKITSDYPVMDPPNFVAGLVAEGLKGASEKPVCNKF